MPGMRFSLFQLLALITVVCLFLGMPSKALILLLGFAGIVVAGCVIGTVLTIPLWIAGSVLKSRSRK